MSQTLQQLCDAALHEAGFSTSASYANATEDTGKQVFRLALREGNDLLNSKHVWNELQKEGSVTLVASQQSYDFPADYSYMLPSTTWDRSNKRIAIGPMSSQEWQFLKGWTTVNGLNRRYRVRDGGIEFEQDITASDAGKAVYFEYVSKYWALDSDGTTAKEVFTSDNDQHVFDDELFILGVLWRFLKAKGFDWQASYAEYTDLRSKLEGRDRGQRVVRLGEPRFGEYLGVNVSDRGYG